MPDTDTAQEPPGRPRRRTPLRLAVAAGAALLALAAAEGVLRSLEGPAYRPVRIDYGFVEAAAGEGVQGLPPHGRASFRWDGDPYDVLPEGARIDVLLNAAGLRGALPGENSAAGTVLFVGDSFTFGEGVVTHETFVERLRGPLDAVGAEPVNAGIPGHGTGDQALQLPGWLERFRPRAVVLVYGLNDPIPLAHAFERGADFVRSNAEPGALRLLELLRRAGEDDATEDWYRDYYFGPAQEHWSAVREQIASMRKQTEAAGARFGVALFPLLHELEDYPLLDLHREVEDACRGMDIPFLDLGPTFYGRETELLWVHPTDHHPNRNAHALAAEALGPFVAGLAAE